MATKTIAWTTGSGNITLTYTGQGNGSISVASDENDLFEDREQSFGIVTTAGTPEKAVSILVKQKGKTYPVGEVFNFTYTGSVQQVTLPKGKYKLQCWGAAGGDVTGTYATGGSKGGYSEGIITLTETTTFYIFVGGQGTSYTSSASQTSTTVINGGWNGGGAGVRTSRYNSGDTDGRSFPRGGGGATDIALVSSALSYSSGRTTRDSASLLSRIIVAGGGAGASAYVKKVTTTTTSWSNIKSVSLSSYWVDGASRYAYYTTMSNTFTKGKTYRLRVNKTTNLALITLAYIKNGSTLQTHQVSNNSTINFLYDSSGCDTIEISARYTTQTSGITYYIDEQVSNTNTSSSYDGSSRQQQGGGTSGKGQYPGKATSAGTGGAFGLGASQAATNYRYCGGGGGGGWYGGGTSQSDSSTGYVSYSGGGSGFVNTSANASSRPSGYTGLQLDSGTTKDGSTSFESTSGGTETGHSGNGYARITVI